MTDLQQMFAVTAVVFAMAAAWHFMGTYRYMHGKHLARTYWSSLQNALKHQHNPVYMPRELKNATPDVKRGFRDELRRLQAEHENA